MADKQNFEERTHDSGIRNAEHGTGSEAHELPPAERDESEDGRYIDPAEAAMNSNPNLSPPIHPKAD